MASKYTVFGSSCLGFVGMCSLASLAGTAAVYGQAVTTASTPQAASSLQEVVVTATRRGPQSALAVPEAVDAFSGTTLSDLGVHSLSDLNQIDPSFEVLSSGATQQRLVVRGIASTTTQTVGIYMDDVPLLGGYNGNTFGDGSPPVRLEDVDEAQVLKGPQGTLFGAGSMSGTLLLETRKPNLKDWGGYADVSGAGVEDGSPEYKGTYVLNAPLIKDVLAVRLVGWTEQGAGYIDKFNGLVIGQTVNHPHSGSRAVHGWRASVLWQPTDKLAVQLTALNQNANVDGPDYSTLRVGVIGAGYLQPPPHTNPWINYDYTTDWTDTTYELYYLRASYDLGFGRLIATASDGQDGVNQDEDTTGSACAVGLCPPSSPPTAYYNDIFYRDYTGEVRFSSNFSGPFQIVAGIFTQQDRKTYYGSALRANPSTGMPLCDGYFDCVNRGLVDESTAISPYLDDVIFLNSERLITHQYAAYAQADYKILPKLTLTLGGRYFSANIDDAANTGFFPSDNFIPFGTPSPEAHQSKPTYNVALLWQATPDWSLYGRVATGFRIGGVNTDAGEAAAAGLFLPSTYKPDWLTDYELGTKIYLLDRRLYFDASIYHIDWTNQQLSGLVAGAFAYQLNAGKTKTDGAELSASVVPLPGLTLSASATYTDSRLATDLPYNVQVSGTPGVTGDPIPYVPRWSSSVRGDYEHSITGNLLGYVEGDVSYRGSSFTTFSPTSATQLAQGYASAFYDELHPYYLMNLKIGVRTGRIEAGLFVRNLMNRFAVQYIDDLDIAEWAWTAPPRTIGADVRVNF